MSSPFLRATHSISSRSSTVCGACKSKMMPTNCGITSINSPYVSTSVHCRSIFLRQRYLGRSSSECVPKAAFSTSSTPSLLVENASTFSREVNPDMLKRLKYAAKQNDLHQAFMILQAMRKSRMQPTVAVYESFLQCLKNASMPNSAMEVLEEMILLGIKPSAECVALAVQVCADRGEWQRANLIIDRMKSLGIPHSSSIYNALIFAHLKSAETDRAFSLLEEGFYSGYSGFKPQTLRLLSMQCLSKRNWERTWEVIKIWKKTKAADGIRSSDWAFWAAGFADGNESMLQLASRHGDTNLVSLILKEIKRSSCELSIHHYSSIIQAFSQSGNILACLKLIPIIDQSTMKMGKGHLISSKVLEPLVARIGSNAGAWDVSFEQLKAFHLESSSNSQSPLSITHFNTFISSCAQLPDLDRALTLFKSIPDYSLKPTIQTYNALLSVCVATRSKQTGSWVYDNLRSQFVEPNSETFAKLVQLGSLSGESVQWMEQWISKCEDLKLDVHWTAIRWILVKSIKERDEERVKKWVKWLYLQGWRWVVDISMKGLLKKELGRQIRVIDDATGAVELVPKKN
ncbi:hypothetical protein BKA69DRAFT_382520 [Paraphysoderma sedebokerense]|nr:hypothetical protein BKA69DRAFT_382520 [Paraphysoderma sedebokerense]